MGYQDDGCALLVPKAFHQPQDLRFYGNVQGRGGLVRNHHLGLAHHGHAYHHPLAQTARKLMGIGIVAFLRLRDTDLFKDLNHLLLCLGPGHLLMQELSLIHI